MVIVITAAVPSHRNAAAVPRNAVQAEPVPGVFWNQRRARKRGLTWHNSDQIVDHQIGERRVIVIAASISLGAGNQPVTVGFVEVFADVWLAIHLLALRVG